MRRADRARTRNGQRGCLPDRPPQPPSTRSGNRFAPIPVPLVSVPNQPGQYTDEGWHPRSPLSHALGEHRLAGLQPPRAPGGTYQQHRATLPMFPRSTPNCSLSSQALCHPRHRESRLLLVAHSISVRKQFPTSAWQNSSSSCPAISACHALAASAVPQRDAC